MISPARDLLELPPFSLTQERKFAELLPRLETLTRHHVARCEPYRHLIDRVFGGIESVDFSRLESIPFLPVSVFKTHTLQSVPDNEVIKVLTSSGTTGQSVSRIHLDAETSQTQAAVLVKVAQHFLGKDRLPMVVLDHPNVLKDRHAYSARGAGILGMLQFGHRPFYALREDMSLDLEGLRSYLDGVRGRRVLLFGFTWMVWEYFVRALEQTGATLDLTGGVLVHSGGWKRLRDLVVSPDELRARIQASTGLDEVINFYGMVEQVGSVYFENPHHHLQSSIFSEVLVRDPVTLAPLPPGRIGLIQVVSCLPTSYPGHSLLTEDLGVIREIDPENLTTKGRGFEIVDRVARAELRGCSDTFQARVA